MPTIMNKKITLTAILFCFSIGIFAQQIPLKYWGINYWMPKKYIYNPTIPNGDVDKPYVQQLVKDAGCIFHRIAGNGYDVYGTAIGIDSLTNDYILAIQKVKNVNPNAKFLIQVPFKCGTFTADSAAKLVQNIKAKFPTEKFYYAIGNEIDRYRKPPNKKYFSWEFAAIIKSFAIEMKNKDATIKIVVPALSSYGVTDSLNKSIMKQLIGGADSITGKITGSPYPLLNGTAFYADVIDFHSYGGLNGNLSGATNNAAFNSNKIGLINYAGVAGVGFSSELDSLIGRLNIVNATRPSSPLTFAITEMNVCYKNQPAPIAGNKYTNSTEGLSARSFFAGQYWADLMSTLLKKGTSTSATSPKVEFIMPWSIHEALGNGSYFDLSMTKGLASASAPKPVSSYYHYQLLSTYFKGKYVDGITNKAPITKTFASLIDSSGIHVMLLNRDTVGYKFSIGFRNNAPAAPLQLTYNISSSNLPLDSANTYPTGLNPNDSIGPNTTVLLFFNCRGTRMWKKSYSLTDAQIDSIPHFKMIGNTNVDPPIAACAQPGGIGGTLVGNKTYANQTVIVNSDLLLASNTHLIFDNAVVIMAPGTKITATPMASIEIKNGTKIYGCNNKQWKGIEMLGNYNNGERLHIINSQIFNAEKPVKADRIADLKITGSTFARGETAIELNRSNAFTISENIFVGFKTGIKTSNTNLNHVSVIKENQFIQMQTGLDFNNDGHNLLEIGCNSFYGFTNKAILSRLTTLNQIGDVNTASGNTFYKSAAGTPTDYIDHTGSPSKYYYSPAEAGIYANPNIMNIPKVQAMGDRVCTVSKITSTCNQITVGIKDNIKSNPQFLIYPNPSTGTFTINYSNLPKGNWTLNIFDVLGKLVNTRKVDANSETASFQIYSKGLYFVVLESIDNRITQKVVVE
jgi:hypothetical protein